jgi:Fe2+ transport system protein FeoA
MNWFRGKGRVHGKKKKHCSQRKRIFHHNTECFSLNDTQENASYLVLANPDKKTNEMGLHAGSVLTVHKNHQTDSNIIIAIGETRYIIPRVLAREILVK